MKVVFAGPSLYGANVDTSGIIMRPPAIQGSIGRAVIDGATRIGLIDGCYESVAAVWHKEILFALSSGVEVFGAASMGALRAAECAHYGMVAVGEIARAYLHGDLVDDAAVAVTHGPKELGYVPLCEALVDVEATLSAMMSEDLINSAEFGRMLKRARNTFFKDRIIDVLVDAVEQSRREKVHQIYEQCRVSVKRRDALELIDAVRHSTQERLPARTWSMCTPALWKSQLNGWQTGHRS